MQSLTTSADYIVCLAVETTASSLNVRRMFASPNDRLSQLSGGSKQETAQAIPDLAAYHTKNSANLPRVVQLEWCVCSVKDFKVIESNSAIVNPGVPLDAATTQQTKLTQDIVQQQGTTFQAALDKMTKQIQTNVGQSKYRVCAFGDWTVRYQLALEALRCNTPLPEAISANFVNVLDLHYDQNPSGQPVGTIDDLLRVNELEPIANENKAKTDGASLVRILNRMIRTFKGQGMASRTESTEESKTEETKRERSRSRTKEETGPKTMDNIKFDANDMVAVKVRGMPWRVEESEIEEFFSEFKWVRDSIRIGKLEGGRSTGHGCILFENEDEAEKALDKDGEYIGPRFVHLSVESFAFHENFMEDQLGCITVNINRMVNEDNVGSTVKLRGLPPSCTKAEILEFFSDFGIQEDNCHIEIRAGRKTGWGMVFLNSEDDQQRARDELNNSCIGDNSIAVMVPRLPEAPAF